MVYALLFLVKYACLYVKYVQFNSNSIVWRTGNYCTVLDSFVRVSINVSHAKKILKLDFDI